MTDAKFYTECILMRIRDKTNYQFRHSKEHQEGIIYEALKTTKEPALLYYKSHTDFNHDFRFIGKEALKEHALRSLQYSKLIIDKDFDIDSLKDFRNILDIYKTNEEFDLEDHKILSQIYIGDNILNYYLKDENGHSFHITDLDFSDKYKDKKSGIEKLLLNSTKI